MTEFAFFMGTIFGCIIGILVTYVIVVEKLEESSNEEDI